jgi:mono/diheme cytochrome c family protein
MLVLAASLVLQSGCTGAAKKSPAPTPAAHLTTSPASNAIANGRSIFITGRDLDGVQITAHARPLFQSCAACHKANGAGGVHFPDGAVSADLRHGALTEGDHPYTIALLQRAISEGIDNERKALDRVMPRWTMSRHDLRDVATYVFTQLK